MRVLKSLLLYLIGFTIAYGFWAAIIWLLSWAFNFTYNWKYPIGIMIVMAFIYMYRKGK